jgi:hypothetical protein
MFMHRVTVYHFKIFKIELNNVYTLKRTKIPLDILRCFFLARQPPSGSGPLHLRDFLDHTKRRTTVSRTPLDE